MVYKKNTLKVLLGPENLLNGNNDEDGSGSEAVIVTSRNNVSRAYEQAAFGKIGDSKVFKRTRPGVQAHDHRPKIERYPTGLQLQGAKVDKEPETVSKPKEEMVKQGSSKQGSATVTGKQAGVDQANATVTGKQTGVSLNDGATEKDIVQDTNVTEKKDNSDDLNPVAPIVPKSRYGRNNTSNHGVSRQFLSDFGLRSDYRPDTFSGHHRRRGGDSVAMKRQMEQAAERHIRTCQVAGNVKRSSRANFGIKGLRDHVSPAHTPMSFYSASSDSPSRNLLRSKTFHRADTNVESSEAVPYLLQVRKNVAAISKSFRRPSRGQGPLPEISGRTILVGESCNLTS